MLKVLWFVHWEALYNPTKIDKPQGGPTWQKYSRSKSYSALDIMNGSTSLQCHWHSTLLYIIPWQPQKNRVRTGKLVTKLGELQRKSLMLTTPVASARFCRGYIAHWNLAEVIGAVRVSLILWYLILQPIPLVYWRIFWAAIKSFMLSDWGTRLYPIYKLHYTRL